MPIALQPFDPSREFVARTNFRAGGLIWLRPQPFDKTAVNDRVLRQLYDARKISYAETTPGAAPSTAPSGKKAGLAKLLKRFKGAVLHHHSLTQTTTGALAADVAEAVVAPDGDAATAAATESKRAELIDQLMIDHSHAQLLEKAADLPAINSKTPKAKIAAALVDAGRA